MLAKKGSKTDHQTRVAVNLSKTAGGCNLTTLMSCIDKGESFNALTFFGQAWGYIYKLVIVSR